MTEATAASATTLRVVAIDGVLGAGKTTVAKRLADALSLEYLDTGAMYRCVGLTCMRAGVDLHDGEAVTLAAKRAAIDVRTGPTGAAVVELDGGDVTEEIRRPEVATAASVVATIAGVRADLVGRQRAWAQARGGGVLEGRDIATVVFPDAPVKIFLTADVHERARRRHQEQPDRAFGDVLADLEWRDGNDSTRAVDPLRVADGATVLDTTGMTLDQVVDRATAIASAALAQSAPDAGPPTIDAVSAVEPVASPEPVSPPRSARSTDAVAPSAPASPPVRPTGSDGRNAFERNLFRQGRKVALLLDRLYFRVTFEGLHNVPRSGAFVLSPVHRSNVDTLVIPGVTPRRMRFLGKDSMWKFAPMGRVFDMLGAIKVVRGSTDRESMRACLAALEGGDPLVVYPEGTRKEGPVVEDLFDGAAYLASKVGVPIVPVGIGGSQKAMGRDDRLPRPRKIHVVVGPPIMPTGTGRSAVRATTAALREELQRLFDQAQAVVEGRGR